MSHRLTSEPDLGGNVAIRCGSARMAWFERERLALRDLKFLPDGEVLIQLQPVCWTIVPNGLYPLVWDADHAIMNVGPSGEDELTIRIEADSTDGRLTNESEVAIRYSEEKQCLVYTVKQVLRVHGEYRWFTTVRELDGTAYAQLEFTNPYFRHVAGPAATVAGHWPGIWLPGQECDADRWRKRWQMVAYERDDGVWEGSRHHHSVLYPMWKPKKNGVIGLFDDVAGNPVYKMIGDTAEQAYVEQCMWGFDLHFVFLKACENQVRPGAGEGVLRPGDVYEVGYEIAALNSEESRKIMEKVTVPPLTELQRKMLDVPVYEAGINTFARSAHIGDMHSFAWESSGEGAAWDRTFGYDDTFSLRLKCDGHSSAAWQRAVGQENFMQAIEAGAIYRLTAMVFAKNPVRNGLRAGVGFGVPRYPGKSGEVLPVEFVWADADVDSGRWVHVSLTAEAPEDARWAQIVFRLEAAGCVWIDNVEFCKV